MHVCRRWLGGSSVGPPSYSGVMTDMCETKDIDGQAVLNEDMLADVSFVSESLSPFFTLEPGSAAVEALYDAFAHLEVGDAADQWPFVEGKDARGPLSAMQKGAARRAALLDESWAPTAEDAALKTRPGSQDGFGQSTTASPACTRSDLRACSVQRKRVRRAPAATLEARR